MKTYNVVGYDKDGGVYEVLYETDEYYDAVVKCGILVAQHKESEIRRSDNGEPFDWFEVVFSADDSVVLGWYK